MTRNTIILWSAIIGVTGLVAIGAVWVWLSRTDSTETDTGFGTSISAVPEATNTVSFDGVKFVPQVIKVKRGSKVYFINNSTMERPMYVASDDHPSHRKYPEFETAAANNRLPTKGENFEFVFDRTGVWNYHDHNFPSAKGTVVVE